jgi:glycine cleavage system aminomethyltransferase T
VEVQDVTDATCCFTLAGPGSAALAAQLGAGQLAGQPLGSHALFGSSRGRQPTSVSVGSGLDQPGFTLVTGQDGAADLWQHLVRLVGVPCLICRDQKQK